MTTAPINDGRRAAFNKTNTRSDLLDDVTIRAITAFLVDALAITGNRACVRIDLLDVAHSTQRKVYSWDTQTLPRPSATGILSGLMMHLEASAGPRFQLRSTARLGERRRIEFQISRPDCTLETAIHEALTTLTTVQRQLVGAMDRGDAAALDAWREAYEQCCVLS